MGSPSLFDDAERDAATFSGPYGSHVPPPSAMGSRTSADAAEAIESVAGNMRQEVYDAIARAGKSGLTREEICDATGLGGDSVRPRVWELLKSGHVIETKQTRRTKAGLETCVLRAANRKGLR